MAVSLCCTVIRIKHLRHVMQHTLFSDGINPNINLRLVSSSPSLVEHRNDKSEGVIKQKLGDLMQWYEKTTGMDEVRMAQDRVLEAEKKFISAQERRREANKEVSDIQYKLKDLYAELDNTTRGEERYVQLITHEHKMLKEEKKIVDAFQRYEKEEREYFSVLSSAVKESHEKERAQAEKTKYWSIIGSIIGTMIGVVGSSVNNELKMKELRRLVKESLILNKVDGSLSEVPEVLSKYEKELSIIMSEMKTAATVPGDNMLGRLNELIHTLDNKVNVENKSPNINQILESLRNQELTVENNFKEMKALLSSSHVLHQLSDDKHVVLPFGLEERLCNQHRHTQYLLVVSTVTAIVIPLMIRYLGVM